MHGPRTRGERHGEGQQRATVLHKGRAEHAADGLDHAAQLAVPGQDVGVGVGVGVGVKCGCGEGGGGFLSGPHQKALRGETPSRIRGIETASPSGNCSDEAGGAT